MIGNNFRRAGLTITELRMLMDIPPPGDDFAFDLSRPAIDFSRGWVLREQHHADDSCFHGKDYNDFSSDPLLKILHSATG